MIGAQRGAILTVLAAVEGAAWDRSTRCPGWSVKDIVAHLIHGEIEVGRVYRGEVSDLGEIDAEHGIARYAALPGDAVRSALWQHGTATQRVLEAMDADRWRAAVRALGCTTVGRLARLHLFEAIIHGSDLTHALGCDQIWEDRIGFATEFVVRAAPPTLTRHGVAPEGSLGLRLGARTALIRGAGGHWEALMDPDDVGGPLLAMEPADLVMAVTGRLPIDEALGRASFGGDQDTVRRVLEGWQVLA